MSKICPTCKKTKTKVEFNKNKGKKDGCASYCIICMKKRARNRNKRKARERLPIQKYDLTLADFDVILDSQRNSCAICKGPPTTYDVFSVDHDHDHDSGRIRGLLCTHCNTGLRRFEDSTKLMESAKRYINNARVNKFRELEIKLNTATTALVKTVSKSENVIYKPADINPHLMNTDNFLEAINRERLVRVEKERIAKVVADRAIEKIAKQEVLKNFRGGNEIVSPDDEEIRKKKQLQR